MGGDKVLAAFRTDKKPRVLIVTPEVSYLPHGMGKIADYLTAKAGGLAEILHNVICAHWSQHLEIVFVADGEFKHIFKNIVDFHDLHDRAAICDYGDKLARLAYDASDFVLMPSSFEPCGLSQMISMRYGSIPIAHNTGGLHDTIQNLNPEMDTGNGFLFDIYDSNGLFWAIDQAIEFFNLSSQVRRKHIERVMEKSAAIFNHAVTARQYIMYHANYIVDL